MIKKDSLHLLEFEKILSFIAGFANSAPSRKFISEILPFHIRERLETQFGQIEEIRRLVQVRVPLRLSTFDDITPLLEAVRPEGAVLDTTTLPSSPPFFRCSPPWLNSLPIAPIYLSSRIWRGISPVFHTSSTDWKRPWISRAISLTRLRHCSRICVAKKGA